MDSWDLDFSISLRYAKLFANLSLLGLSVVGWKLGAVKYSLALLRPISKFKIMLWNSNTIKKQT